MHLARLFASVARFLMARVFRVHRHIIWQNASHSSTGGAHVSFAGAALPKLKFRKNICLVIGCEKYFLVQRKQHTLSAPLNGQWGQQGDKPTVSVNEHGKGHSGSKKISGGVSNM